MEELQRQLEQLERIGMRRVLRTVAGAQGPKVTLEGREVLLLCSNNYLGLANHPRLVEAACAATREFGTGSGASRLISGTMELHSRLEERIASFKRSEAALVFNSGFAANTGILQGLLGPDDLVFSDRLNHASIVDGCRLSKARTVIYPHADVAALERLMEQEAPNRKGRWLIVTDGVFSMDGDQAPLRGLVALKERFDAWLMVDDAHGTGVLGEGGRGTAEAQGVIGGVDLQMGTLGKALGGFGAYLAAPRVVVDTLINRARPFIFSTSLPPGVLAAALEAIDMVQSDEGRNRRERLARNRELFARRLEGGGVDLAGSTTQIIPVLTYDPEPTMAAAARLLERGLFVQGIRPPTVERGRCRLRATVMADHEPGELEAAAEQILQTVSEGEG